MVCSAGAWLIWLLPFEDNRLVIFTQLKAQDPGFLPSEGMGLYLLTPFKAKGPPCLLGSRELSRVTPLHKHTEPWCLACQKAQGPGSLPLRAQRTVDLHDDGGTRPWFLTRLKNGAPDP